MRGKLLTVLIFMLVWPSLSFGQVNDVVKVEFTSVARGRPFERIVVSMDSLLVTQGDDTKVRVISPGEWKEIRHALKNLSLAGMQELTSPTMKRTYDGASHSTLIITDSKGNTACHGFDDYDPHEKLKRLMECMLKLRGD